MATLVKNLKLSDQVYKLGDLPKVYIPKGSITVAQANAGVAGIDVGWVYNMSDSGTITNGTGGTSFNVSVGDNICWINEGTEASPVYCWDKIGSSGATYTGTDPITVDAATNTISVKTAAANQLGVVKPGANVSITNGAINVATGTDSIQGVVTSGANTAITTGALSVSLDKAAQAESKTVYADATLGDLFRMLGGTVNPPVVYHNLHINDGETEYATLADALTAAASVTGDITISAYDDFEISGSEDWTGLSSRNIVIEGKKSSKSTIATYGAGVSNYIVPKAVSSISFKNMTINGPFLIAGGVFEDTNINAAMPDTETDVDKGGIHVLNGSGSHGKFYMTRCVIDCGESRGKYAVDIADGRGGDDRDTFTDCTFKGFAKAAVGFSNHAGNATFTNCVFDGAKITKKECSGLVNFMGTASGNPVFTGCTFKNSRREIDGHIYNGPCVGDRVVDTAATGTITFSGCTVEDTVAYLIGYGDASPSTHLHFTVTGDNNVWTDWDDTTKTGTKLTLVAGSENRYTGVGYVGDGYVGDGTAVETPWAGTGGYEGDVGSVGRADA